MTRTLHILSYFRLAALLRPAGLLLLAALLLVAASCSYDEGLTLQNGVRVPITIRVAMESSSRAPGDPGDVEFDQLPTNVYIWVCTVAADGGEYVYNITATLDRNKWEQDPSDPSIWKYNCQDDVNVLLPRTTLSGRVYAAVAVVPEGKTFTFPLCETEAAVKALTFDIDGFDDKGGFIKNLYSSPAEKKYPDDYEVTALQGEYYGTLNPQKIAESAVPLDLMLYHVAAKLDVTWNVAAPYLLKKLVIKDLYQKNCSLFYPAVNAGVNLSSTYDETFETTVGNQWNGRKSVYIIQCKDRETFSFDLYLNGNDTPVKGTGTLQEEPSGYYTQWYRGTIVYPKPKE